MARKRRRFAAEFKAKVASELVRGQTTFTDGRIIVAGRCGVPTTASTDGQRTTGNGANVPGLRRAPTASGLAKAHAAQHAGGGAAAVSDRLRRVVLCYRDLDKQSELLEFIRFLDRHADRMAYPDYQAADLPIGSGPMESFCKQIGARMKGAGMRWCTRNVTPMAMLVSRWSLEPERASSFGALPEAA